MINAGESGTGYMDDANNVRVLSLSILMSSLRSDANKFNPGMVHHSKSPLLCHTLPSPPPH